MIRATAEKTIIDLTEPISVILSNESQSFSTNSNRLPLSNASYYTDVIVYRGSNEITDFVIGNVSSANGITVGANNSRITFSVKTSTTITADSGTFIIPITVDEQVIKKTFSWSCSKQGNTGQSAVTYFIEPSTLVIKKGYDDTFSPTTVTFSSYSRIGSSTTRTSYAGRFIISESTDGTTFTAKYTSSTNESSKVYTPSSVNIKTIKCVLYASGGTTSSLDTQSVVILTDVENIQPELDNLQDQITTNKTSISTVSSEVDAINKKIVNMVTQDDIESSINDYDKSTTEALRTRISKTEQDIGGIKTTVSDVQSNLKNKADSSTVQSLNSKVTTIETTVNGINTAVSNNYTELRKDIDNLEIGGRNLISNSVNNWVDGNWQIPDVGSPTSIHDYPGRISLKQPITITPNTEYWVKIYSNKKVTFLFRMLDASKNFIDSKISLTNQKWISPSNCYSICVTIYENSAISDIADGTTKIKIEKGNKATDWTPAPEDVDAEIADANAGKNKWKVQIYPKSTLPGDLIEMVTVDFLSYGGVYPSNTYLIDDTQLSTSFPYSNSYIGYAITRLNIDKSTSVNTTFSIKSSGLLYVNNTIVEPDSNGKVTFTLLPGWNTLEVVWNVSDTDATGGFQFGTHLSKLSACSLMNCLYESVTANITNSIQKNAELQVAVGSIQTQISEINSEIVQKADGSVMTEIQERLTESISDLNGFKQTVSETYISNAYKTEVSSQFAQMLEEINMKVSTAEMETAIALTKNQWRIDFAENGASCGYFSVNKNGITVAGEDGSGYKTVMSSTEFAGYFNNSRVFWLNQDETVSMRLRVDKGIDLRTIKLIPVTQDEYRGLDFLGGNAII